jgi:hypothetical protein
MKTKVLSYSAVSLLALSLLFGGCAAKTVTVSGPAVTVTAPGPALTITAPGSVVTVPAATVTLPGKTTTIPVTVVTLPPISTTLPPQPTGVEGFLPVMPVSLTTHGSIVNGLVGQCLICHGPTEYYNQFPMAPGWDASVHGSSHHTGYFRVVSGSIQDHTGRDDDGCLNCHKAE